jgi:hypothetical protein
MKRILITGGPVHANLDAVKIITNRFRGGRMVDLAIKLGEMGYDTTYLTAKQTNPDQINADVLLHDGFHDYMKQVAELTPDFDAVILGAAVANLIPVEPWKGKFPSHNYKPGDVIPINFTIAPRVIDQVKKHNPNTHLFGFKLLKDVSEKELLDAAYDIVLESRASAVFANDATNLNRKLVITKEHSVQEIVGNKKLAKFISEMIEDEYYKTRLNSSQKNIGERTPIDLAQLRCKKYAGIFASKFEKTYGKRGLRFGTIATRVNNKDDSVSFVTTVRGKEDLKDWTYVKSVNHEKMEIVVEGPKATLNAPLLHYLFDLNPECKTIVHFHETNTDLPCVDWAPPGTKRDSLRRIKTSFEIQHHGVFHMYGENNELLR